MRIYIYTLLGAYAISEYKQSTDIETFLFDSIVVSKTKILVLLFFIPAARSRTTTLLRLHPSNKILTY